MTAAIAHLAHSTPPEFLFTATDFNSYVTVSTAEGAPQRQNGRMAASTAPGLGITPRLEVLRSRRSTCGDAHPNPGFDTVPTALARAAPRQVGGDEILDGHAERLEHGHL